MTLLFAGLAILLLATGTFFTFYRNRTQPAMFELPMLKNGYRNKTQLAQKLGEWVTTRNPALGAWFKGLSVNEQKGVVQEIDTYCKKHGFVVGWVLDQQIEDGELQATLTKFLLQFLDGQRMLAQSRPDLNAYVALVDMVQNIGRRKRKQNAQLVYLELVNLDVIPRGNVDMLLSQDRSRWDNAAQSITLAARTNRSIVNLVVREHVLGEPPRVEISAAQPTRA